MKISGSIPLDNSGTDCLNNERSRERYALLVFSSVGGLRWLGGVLLAIGLLLVSSLCTAKGLPNFKAAKFMRVTVVADAMIYNGLPMRAYEFTASKSVDKVEAFYAELWGKELKKSQAGPWTVLSHFDGTYLFSVQVEEDDTQRAVGLLSVSEPGAVSAKFELGEGFPMPQSSTVVNDISAQDLGKNSRTLVLVNDQSVASNLRFYRRHYEQRGWMELAPSDPTAKKKGSGKSSRGGLDDANALLMSKGGDELNMSFDEVDGRTVVVAVEVDK
jgi:hypothetical protein